MPAADVSIRVVIVDDHPMVREGLRRMLDDAGIDVVGEAGTAVDALRVVRELTPDVVLLDVELSDGDGLTALPELRRAAPQASVLIVTMHSERALLQRFSRNLVQRIVALAKDMQIVIVSEREADQPHR